MVADVLALTRVPAWINMGTHLRLEPVTVFIVLANDVFIVVDGLLRVSCNTRTLPALLLVFILTILDAGLVFVLGNGITVDAPNSFTIGGRTSSSMHASVFK